MTADIRIACSLLGHPKRVKLSKLLGQDGTGYLLDLWIRAAALRPDGVLTDLDAEDIAILAGWPGDHNAFVQALLLCRWLDKRADGVFVLHDWAEHQAWVVGGPARKEQAKKAISTRWSKAEKDTPTRAVDKGSAVPVARKMPEVGQKNTETVLPEYSENTASILPVYGQNTGSNTPLLSPSSSSTLQKGRKAPPVRDKSLTSPQGGKRAFLAAFETWYALYPRKVKPVRAREAWAKAWDKNEGLHADTLIEALRAQLAVGHLTRSGPVYIPHPSTWLNGGQWADEIGAGTAGTSAREKLKAMQEGAE